MIEKLATDDAVAFIIFEDDYFALMSLGKRRANWVSIRLLKIQLSGSSGWDQTV